MITRIAIADMSVAQMRAQIDVLQKEKDDIHAQIRKARIKASAEGRFADRNWYSAAIGALHARGRAIGRLQVALGERLKAERQQRAKGGAKRDETFERVFMQKAREAIPPALYQQLIGETIAAVKQAATEGS